jgi:hypothetical protein
MKHAEKFSKQVFYGIIVIIAVIFCLFYFVGFHTPYWENPNFNAPLMTNVLLVFMFLLFVGTVGVVAWSMFTSLKKRGKGESVYNGIPVKRNAYIVSIGTILLLLITLLLASTSPMMINGKEYADAGWLKIADMFIWSSLILILVAFGTIVFGASRNWRKGYSKRH